MVPVLLGPYLFFLLCLATAWAASPSSSAQPPRGTGLAKAPYAPLNVTAQQARDGVLFPSASRGLTLNASLPVAWVKLPRMRAWTMTVWIGQRGYNTTALPSDFTPDVRVTMNTATNFLFEDRRASDDDSSGGTAGKPNRSNRAGDTWKLRFDDGFANFTYGWDMSTNEDWNVTDDDAANFEVLFGLSLTANATSTAPASGNVTVYWQVVDLAHASADVMVTSYRAETGLLGDSTATAALLFSPVIYAPELPQPSYPNYTLPGAEPQWPAFVPEPSPLRGPLAGMFGKLTDGNFTFVVQRTTDSLLANALGKSVIALALAGAQTAHEATSWTRVNLEPGFRKYAVVEGLQPDTNYTFWIFDRDHLVMYPPALFRTKKQGFRCPLMLPTAMCPGVGYASPLADGASFLTDIPEEYSAVIADNLGAFSASLTAQACGRDMYSYVSTCADCYDAYRDWVCRMVLPQCADEDPVPFENVTRYPTAPVTIAREANASRNALQYPYGYNELLPCIAACTEVDRVCPLNLQFICPHRNFNANESYAFEGRKNGVNDGQKRNGRPSIDRFGNRWCNI